MISQHREPVDQHYSIQDVQSAILNILEDVSDANGLMTQYQSALFNILEDFSDDKDLNENSQKAMLNILEDAANERLTLVHTQKAVLNILEDYEVEKKNIADVNEKLKKAKDTLEEHVEERTRKLKTINQELESFSYSVSHDLRAPLRAIVGFSGILAEDYADAIDDDGKKLIKTIVNNAKKMGQLIDDILEFSRLGRQKLGYQKMQLTSMFDAVVKELVEQEPNRKITVEFGDLGYVYADKLMLTQLISNLISNAIKYTGQEEHAIIQVGVKTDKNETIYFVRDNGVGFNQKYVDKIFGVFQRLHKVSEFEGTGVGLAIAQRVVLQHGGRIWAEGAINRGATFYFTLPTPLEVE